MTNPGEIGAAVVQACPHCGGDAWAVNSAVSSKVCVMCKRCGATGGLRPTEADAIAAWNTRPEPAGVGVLDREAVARLRERMSEQLANWEEDEPRDDWWAYQREYAKAYDLLALLPASGAGEDAKLLADAATHYSAAQIEAMQERAEHLRSEIRRCSAVIENGAPESWWYEARSQFQRELRGIEAALSRPVEAQ